MRYYYKPKENIEKFSLHVYNLLVENFPQTFFVGGMVRDLLLGIKVTDIDIATSATPDETKRILEADHIAFNASYARYGAVIAQMGSLKIEITTFRKDLKAATRYPKVIFTNSLKIDSQRRDFTVNSLYLSVNNNKILDFHKGLADIKDKVIRFIGNPTKRIHEDPLRIIRALRFAAVLNFKIEKNTLKAIKNNFGLINNLTQSRKQKEIDKLKNQKQKNILKSILNDPKSLDNYIK